MFFIEKSIIILRKMKFLLLIFVIKFIIQSNIFTERISKNKNLISVSLRKLFMCHITFDIKPGTILTKVAFPLQLLKR